MATGIEIVGGIAACIEVVKFSKRIIEFISDINRDVSEIDDTLLYFKNTINGIGKVFNSIQDAIKEQGLSESDGFVEIVAEYGEHCAFLLRKLEEQLPTLAESARTKQKAWVALLQKINGKAIKEKVEFLQRYMQITQIALWGIESRRMLQQGAKIDQMRVILREVAAVPPYSPTNPDDRDYDRLRTNIDKIREVATSESSICDFDMDSVPSRRAENLGSFSGLDNLPPSIRTLLIQERTLSAAELPTSPPRNDPVETLEGRGMFLKAANEISQPALWNEEEIEQEERRADLLLKCATIGHHQRALELLIQLWELESQQNDDHICPKRLGQLGSKVARLLLDSRRLGHFTEQERAADCDRASSVLDGSMKVLLDKIETLRPYPYKTMLSVGELLIHLLKETGKATYADKTGNILRRRLGDLEGDPYPIPPDWPHKFEASRSDALAWCEPASLARLHEMWPETATVVNRPDLLKQKFDVRSADFRFDKALKGISPLHLAVIFEEKEILREMLGEVEHIDVGHPGTPTPLMEAALNGSEDVANILLAHDASVECVDAQQRTALHWAQIGNGKNAVGVSQLLLDAAKGGPLLEKKDVDGKTALCLACKKGNGDMVELLVTKHKARVNVADVFRKTALHATVEAKDRPEERLRIARILLKAKANPNTSDYGDRTPLCIACSRGNYELVHLLLEHNADPNRKGPEGQTPLIVATRIKHVDIVLALMKRGAQPNRKDASGQSALNYAERTKTTSDIYNLLCGGAPSSRRQNSFASAQSAPPLRSDTSSTRSLAHRSFDLASKGSSSSSRPSS